MNLFTNTYNLRESFYKELLVFNISNPNKQVFKNIISLYTNELNKLIADLNNDELKYFEDYYIDYKNETIPFIKRKYALFLLLFNLTINLHNAYLTYQSLKYNTNVDLFFSGKSIYEDERSFDEIKLDLLNTAPYDVDILELFKITNSNDYSHLTKSLYFDLYLLTILSNVNNKAGIKDFKNKLKLISLLNPIGFTESFGYKLFSKIK